MSKKRRVAVMIELDWPFNRHMEVFAGCQKYAAEAGWDCSVNPFADRAIKPHRGGSPYDGILARATRNLADKAQLAGVPVVNVWVNSPARDLPSVFQDSEAAGAMAANHLLGLGFRQFGFMGYSRDLDSRLQFEAFSSVIQNAGFSCSVHRFGLNDPARPEKWDGFIADLGAWVDTWTKPIGVYSTQDLPCRYLVDVCRQRGLHVPQDVAMIGSGNELVICAAPPPTLTSINLGYANIGYRAAELLDRLMDGHAPPDGPELLAPAELIPRQSTDSYAVDDPLVARALRFIAEHGHEPIKVDDVAAATPTTRRSLERRFQNAVRRTIGDEIIRMRLERAKRRLVEADEPLKKVAKDSGFSSDNHFYRAFIRSEGVSPSLYRKQRRAEN